MAAINILKCATHVVANAAAAAARFERWMGYRTVEAGRIADELARLWESPASAGRAYALCRPGSGADGFLRFVEGDPVPEYRPIRTYGWAAIELCVEDVLAVDAAMRGAPFEVIGTPSPIPGIPTIHPMQVRGPDAETIYLTQILTDAPDSGLPKDVRGIDRPFILVLACADLATNARWFADTLGVTVSEPVAIRYRMIANAFGLPLERLHEIATASFDGDIFVELSHYPDAATVRPGVAGALPPGVAIGTFAHSRFDTIRGDWTAPPVVLDGPLYRDRRVGVLRSPEGALVEIVDAG